MTAAAGTFAVGDVLADGSTTDNDVLNVTDTGGVAVAASVTNIETINMDVKAAGGGLNMTSVTGAKNVNITASANAVLTNVAVSSAPTIGFTGTNTLTTTVNTLAGTTAAGTAETLNVVLKGASGAATLSLAATVAGALETLNLESAGSAKNTVALTAAGSVTAINKTVVTGETDVELRAAAGVFNNQTLDGSGHKGAFTLRADFNGAGALVGMNAEKFSGVDSYVVADLTGATADAFGLYNIASGATVRIADDFLLGATNSIITVAGAAAGASDSLAVTLQNRATTATDVDLTGLTVAGIENLTITSSGAPTTGAAGDQQNDVGNLTAAALQNLTIDGASNVKVVLTAGSITTANTSNITVDASELTGKLEFQAGNVADTTAGGRTFTINGGTNDDLITGVTRVAVKNVFDLTAGGKDTVNVNVGDSNDSIIAFANGDKVALGATAGTFVNGINSTVISAANQATIEAAANITAAATIAGSAAVAGITVNNALVFSYQGSQYLFMNEADAGAAGAWDVGTDSIVKISGVTSTSTFDAGTFLFAA